MTYSDDILSGKIKESTPLANPPKERDFKDKDLQGAIDKARAAIEQKKAELELKKLEIEVKRLEKPDIGESGYFEKMMTMQQQHFNQNLEMIKNQMDLKLEIEKLKLLGDSNGGDDTLAYLDMLKPLLPLIVEGIKKKKEQPEIPKETEGLKGGNMIKTAEELEEYKKKIKSGEITEEQAYKDFLEQVPPIVAKKMGREGFKKEFDKVKNE